MKSLKRTLALLLMLAMMLTTVLAVIPFASLKASAVSGAGAPTDFTYYARGIDISAWQAGGGSKTSLVNFTKLKNSGCEFVILRIGYGQNLDKAFVSFYNNARAAGMPLGLYMYGLSTTRAGGVSDAKWVISIIEKYDMYFEYPIYYDLEEQKQINLSASQKNALCEGWCDTLAAAGYFPGIYAGKSQICDSLTASFKAKYDLWVPHVKSGAGSEWSSQYTYTSIAYNQKGFGMWQYSWSNVYNGSYIYDGVYSSGTKKVAALDLDVCYKDYPTIMKTYGYNNCGVDEKSMLNDALKLARDKRYDQYTSDGVTNLRNAYNSALTVYNSTSSTSDDYKNARTALETAMKGASTSVISTGKSYTVTNTANPGSDQADDGKKLTDGDKGNSDGGTNKFFGAKGTEIVVDLGSAQSSNIYKIYMAAGSWGVAVPYGDQLDIDIQISNDGTNFTHVVSANNSIRTGVKNGEWETVTLTAVADQAVSARYVKFTVTSYATNNYVWLDEVEVISGDPLLSGNVYVNGMNQKVGSGDCFVFTSGFGEITVDSANHAWTANVIAKWDSDNKYIVTKKFFGEGDATPSVTLASDEIMICSNNWETGVTDGTAVVGSAANTNTLYGIQVGDALYLDGIDAYNVKMDVVSYISFATEATQAPVHNHTPGPFNCLTGQICLSCGDAIVEATGAHDDGEWVATIEDGVYELKCTACGEVLDIKIEEDIEKEPIVPENDYMGLRGDVNLSGEIDMMDYVLLKRNYFGTFEFTEQQILLADINEDSNVEMMDYILLKRVYFGTFTIANAEVYK